MNKIQRNFSKNTRNSFQLNAFKNVVCKILAILWLGQWVNPLCRCDTMLQCCRKCKILAHLMDHLWLIFGWSVSVLGSPPINILLRPCNQSKNVQNGPNRAWVLLRHNGLLISVHLWNRLSTFIPKHFLQNLKNPLVAKQTIYGRTLGRPVDSWVAFGDRATVFQQHCADINRGQYGLRLGAWLRLAITWTNVDSSSMWFCNSRRTNSTGRVQYTIS